MSFVCEITEKGVPASGGSIAMKAAEKEKNKLPGLWNMLGRSLYVGDRLKANLLAISAASLFCVILGLALLLLNTLSGSGSMNFYRILMSAVTIISGTLCFYIAYVRKDRKHAIIIPTLFCVIVFTFYALTGYAEATGILWSLLLPIGMCYFISVRSGIILSLYYCVLYMIIFYTPLSANLKPYYNNAFMVRFPLAYASLSAFTIIAMIQYHRTALLELDYTDRLNREVARQTAVAEERSRRIEQMSFQTIQTLANAIDAKDPYTRGHSTRVSQYAVLIAEKLGWDQERISDLRYAALLHDIGKIGVPDSILNNPNRLTDVEFEIIRAHTTMGGDILHNRIMVGMAEDVARSHHERYDGTGYPRGLKGTEIPEEARIVSVADAFDAMNSDRVFRKAFDREYILRELTENRGRQFDPDITDILAGLWAEGSLDPILRNESPESKEEIEASSALLRDVVESFVSQNLEKIDLVTGILNRTAGEAAIAKAMKEHSGCFVFFDMDNLKKINDIYGHQAGDRALRMMGEILTENSGNGICCRLGGDEFLLFLPGAAREAAEDRVRKIIRDFTERKDSDDRTVAASLSAGMVMCTPADSFSGAYNKADKALYLVKQNGKDGFSFYIEDPDSYQDEPLDLNKLISGIRTSGSYDGAMDVEYRHFTRLYELFDHIRQRYSQDFKLIMITMKAGSGESVRSEELEKAMSAMEQAIRQAIRNVDVLTRYSRQQYLVILQNTDDQGVKIAVERIFRAYYMLNGVSVFFPSYVIAEPESEANVEAD